MQRHLSSALLHLKRFVCTLAFVASGQTDVLSSIFFIVALKLTFNLQIHIEETRGTLQFASRAKCVSNCAQVNEVCVKSSKGKCLSYVTDYFQVNELAL